MHAWYYKKGRHTLIDLKRIDDLRIKVGSCKDISDGDSI